MQEMDIIKPYQVYLTESQLLKIKFLTKEKKGHIALQVALLTYINEHEA